MQVENRDNSIEYIRQKRKRYRTKKKRKLWHLKHKGTTNKSVCSPTCSSPAIDSIAKCRSGDLENHISGEATPIIAPSVNYGRLLPYAQPEEASTTSSASESLPGKHAFDDLLEEASQIRSEKKIKESKLAEKYANFVDSCKAFKDDQGEFRIPDAVEGVDRIYIKTHMRNLLYKENQALQSVRLYRDRCTELQNRCRELETEKEAVRFFWRNKVLESQTRAGSLLMHSLSKKNL